MIVYREEILSLRISSDILNFRFGNIILSPTEEGLLCGFQTKDFSLRQHNESGGMKVRLIFCPEWSTDKPVTSSPTDESLADIEAQTSSGQV